MACHRIHDEDGCLTRRKAKSACAKADIETVDAIAANPFRSILRHVRSAWCIVGDRRCSGRTLHGRIRNTADIAPIETERIWCH